MDIAGLQPRLSPVACSRAEAMIVDKERWADSQSNEPELPSRQRIAWTTDGKRTGDRSLPTRSEGKG